MKILGAFYPWHGEHLYKLKELIVNGFHVTTNSLS